MGSLSGGDVGGALEQDGGVIPGASLCLCPRLLHSLTNLKRVIINAAHYLVLGDRDAYRHDPAAPFLSTVSSTSLRGSPCPRCPMPPGSTALPAGSVLGGGSGTEPQPVPVSLGPAGSGGGCTPALTAPLSPQDDVRPNQDSLPERTVVKLDTLPR